jgi:hypothetical protein
MSSIQSVGSSAASYVAPKPLAAAATEARETAQDERNEAIRGTQEAGESKPTTGVGSKVNLTA